MDEANVSEMAVSQTSVVLPEALQEPPRTSNLLFLMLFEGGKHGDRCREYHYFH